MIETIYLQLLINDKIPNLLMYNQNQNIYAKC
jgi:hypothetical protein